MKTAVVHRYKVAPTGISKAAMPKGAHILCITAHPQGLQIFATHEVPEDADATPETEERFFVLAKTGVPYPVGAQWHTSIVIGGHGFHVFELTTPEQRDAWEAMYPAINEADAGLAIDPHA